MFQPVAQGALPTLFAATSPDAKPGMYYGPHALREMRGYPHEASIPRNALNSETSSHLWKVSEELSGVRYA